MIEDFNRLLKNFEVIRKVDFFLSKKGTLLETRIKTIHNEIKTLSTEEVKKPEKLISQKDRKDYQGRVWVTRKRPYVDRIASAWLIRKFIDPDANYTFIAEEATSSSEQGKVTFDMSRGEFTHQGDLCTFEVLIKSFALKDKALRKMVLFLLIRRGPNCSTGTTCAPSMCSLTGAVWTWPGTNRKGKPWIFKNP